MSNPKLAWVQQHTAEGVRVLDETLQEQSSPVEYLKTFAEQKFVIVVPDEWAWPPELKPFTNEKHKQRYDAETLAEDLEAAGLVYAMKDVSFSGWSFLCAEASK